MDVTQIYLDDIGAISLLNAVEEVALAKRIEAARHARDTLHSGRVSPSTRRRLEATIRDGERAKHEFVEANLRLVVSVARRYTRRGVELSDLVQEGNLGLLRAVERYDWRLGYKFSTYATWWIRQAIWRTLGTESTLHLPLHKVDQLRSLRRLRDELRSANGSEPSVEELADLTGLSAEQITELTRLGEQPLSLSAPVADDGTELGDLIADPSASSPESMATDDIARTDLAARVGALPDRQAALLRWRFGLDGGPPQTLQEIGHRLGVTRERVRQLEKRALCTLREGLAATEDSQVTAA